MVADPGTIEISSSQGKISVPKSAYAGDTTRVIITYKPFHYRRFLEIASLHKMWSLAHGCGNCLGEVSILH
jgi:hypothetical protein